MSLNLQEFIMQYIKLIPEGENYKALCPFHEEKTPSFIVSPSKNIFHCFGCGKTGDALSFIRDFEGISQHKAQQKINIFLGIPTSEESVSDLLTKQFFEMKEALLNTKEAQDYLIFRGLTKSDWANHQLGYIESLNSIGFPIFDEDNQLIGFTTRRIDDKQPKVKHSSNSDIFYKKSVLYPLPDKNKVVTLVEGQIDALRLRGKKINASAILGSELSNEQVKLLKRLGIITVVLMFDNDKAGFKCTEKAGEMLKAKGINTLYALYEGSDPDSWVGGEGLYTETTSFKEWCAYTQYEYISKNYKKDTKVEIKPIEYLVREGLKAGVAPPGLSLKECELIKKRDDYRRELECIVNFSTEQAKYFNLKAAIQDVNLELEKL